MKILRSVNRQGFNVGTAGWFTVLRPNTWFAASRLPGVFHYPSGRFRGTGEITSTEQQTKAPSLLMSWDRPDHRRGASAWIVLAATAITSVLLLWIIQAR